jgi:hypothetical protein
MRWIARTTFVVLTACGAAESSERPPSYPGNAGPLCSYVGLEADSTPAHETADSVMMVAVFRLSEPDLAPPKQPIELKFQVHRSRVDELRGRLEAHPEVICRPDGSAHYQVEAKAFDDFAPQQP